MLVWVMGFTFGFCMFLWRKFCVLSGIALLGVCGLKHMREVYPTSECHTAEWRMENAHNLKAPAALQLHSVTVAMQWEHHEDNDRRRNGGKLWTFSREPSHS